ncbi:MAG: serine/threonine-protein kinase [Myxococcales bacterium]|nr:serine/threonine-protein kinase [Myxococcales bacterium]
MATGAVRPCNSSSAAKKLFKQPGHCYFGGSRTSELCSDSYDVQEEIGRGGVAIVYRAIDRTNGREVALKGMREFRDPARARRALEFFEREFHALAQLSHPNVVEAYDYEVSPAGAFYTMEFLVGDDLQATAPMDYQEACGLMRDVCSALCLIHSRRLVHRDISPRNVLRIGDMSAKLIDFGALSPMGHNRQIVGTPPFCPPEVLNRETLDARSDLYSLGTTLYFVLSGRHACPARDFRQLRQLWNQPPVAPSQLVPQIPETLDALVMELIALDPNERPDSAAEVMQRLTSIAGLPADELPTASAAYLATPTLVGRAQLLSGFRARLRRAHQGRGRALAIAADAGLGRTRALEACALEAKLAGGTVLRADRLDAQLGEYGAARALCQQLLELHPSLTHESAAPHGAILPAIVPELAQEDASHGAQAPERLELQRALRDFFLTVCKQEPLALVVDDVDRIDEPSTALLAQLAAIATEHPLLLLTSSHRSDPEGMPPSLRILLEHSKPLELPALSASECEALLGSIFGTPAHLAFVADRLHQVTSGNPRDVMQLAQHLVDRGIARYAGGAWTLPAEFDAADLPDSLANAMAERVNSLSGIAKTLGRALALAPDNRWTVNQCHQLAGHDSRAATLTGLDELLTAGVVDLLGQRYGLSQRGWVAPLVADLDAANERDAHRRIAAQFEQGGETFRRAQHLLRAGDHAQGVDVLVEYARESKQQTNDSDEAYRRFLAALPTDFEDSYRQAIALCSTLGRPPADAYALKARLSSALTVSSHAWAVLLETLAVCEEDAGLAYFEQLDATADPAERVQQALGTAQARYERLGHEGTVFDPASALRELVSVTVEGLGIVSNHNNYEGLRRLPSLEPLAPISPAFLITDWIRQAIGERLSGRLLSARAGYARILERLSEPDQAGLSGPYFSATCEAVILTRGLVDCTIGSDNALQAAGMLADAKLMGSGPLQLRMLHHLMQGDGVQADKNRRELESAQVQSNIELRYESPMLVAELIAVALSDDLGRLRRIFPHVERWARRAPSWRPMLHYALGEQHRTSGDFGAAMASHRRGLMEAHPGEHQMWPLLAGSHVRCLLRLGRTADAVETGQRYLAQAKAANVDLLSVYIKMPLAMALSARGEHQSGMHMARDAIAELQAQGAGGIPLVLAHMVEARVSLKAGDADGFEAAMERCTPFFESCTTRSLTSKYRQMMRDGRKVLRAMRGGGITVSDFEADPEAVVAHLTTEFDTCQTQSERAELTARLLADYCKSEELYLYVPDSDGPRLAAWIGSEEPPSDFTDMVSGFLAAEAGEASIATATGSDDDGALELDAVWALNDGRCYRPTLLGHRSTDGFVITGVAVAGANHNVLANAERLATELSRIGLDVPEGPRTLVATTQLTDIEEVGTAL